MAEIYERRCQCDRDRERNPVQDPEALVLVVLTDHQLRRGLLCATGQTK